EDFFALSDSIRELTHYPSRVGCEQSPRPDDLPNLTCRRALSRRAIPGNRARHELDPTPDPLSNARSRPHVPPGWITDASVSRLPPRVPRRDSQSLLRRRGCEVRSRNPSPGAGALRTP